MQAPHAVVQRRRGKGGDLFVGLQRLSVVTWSRVAMNASFVVRHRACTDPCFALATSQNVQEIMQLLFIFTLQS